MLIHWLIEEGLMAKEHLCPMCEGETSLARCEDQSDLFKWECRRQEKSKRHKAEISISGWFEKSKMTLEEILKLIYWWCQDLDQAQIKHELELTVPVSTGIAFVVRYAKSLFLKIVRNSGERERLCRLMKASLGNGSIIEDIMWRDNGYSAV